MRQKQALALYREVLRAARQKPADGRTGIEALARSQFDQYRGIGRKEFNRIEHLLRRGKRQAEVLRQGDVGGVTSISSVPPPSQSKHGSS